MERDEILGTGRGTSKRDYVTIPRKIITFSEYLERLKKSTSKFMVFLLNEGFMSFKKMGSFVVGLFLFPINLLFAEIIGNVEFEPPVSLEDWRIIESSKNEESPLKIYMQYYEHEQGSFKESLHLMNFYSKELPIYSKGFSKEPDIKSYLTNKYQKICDQTCAQDKSYSTLQVLVTNIVADPTSLFYQVTMFDGEKIVGCIWSREIKKKGQWIQFNYGLLEKHPGDLNCPVQDMEKIASPWIKLLKDDFSEKVIYPK
jgi:hypothetical protein